jgi:hypothetical protein
MPGTLPKISSSNVGTATPNINPRGTRQAILVSLVMRLANADGGVPAGRRDW